jgi:hypothetical protein
MKRTLHLARRFLGALRPGRPAAADDAWVQTFVNDGEYSVWAQLPNHDRRHSIGVARRVQRALADTEYAGQPEWLEAALLHDVGKLDAHLGVFGRVGATLVGGIAGGDAAQGWSSRRGYARRVGLYLRHGELGAALIRDAGGTETAARWAAAHHVRSAWTATGIPAPVVDALHAADDD